MNWFEQITGFREGPYTQTQAALSLREGRLHGRGGRHTFGVGTLTLPSLADLRAETAAVRRSGRSRLAIVQGDVRALHRAPENRGALFQVASQFNMLEMIGPDVTPEDGVSGYVNDPTQGPACAIAAGAATIYRNYLVPVGDGIGQTRERQLDGLLDLGAVLAECVRAQVSDLWTMRNGYPVEMPGAQAAAYQRIVMEAQQGAGSRKPGDMLRVIHALRGVSLHPDDPERVEGPDARSFAAFAARSARLQTALDILRAVHRRGEKAILFIESLAMQQVVARGVSELFDLPVLPGIINGGTPGEQRQRIVDGFQAAPPGFGLLVLSPKAAGVGLTITAANHVIHLSRWWNPAVEDQCNDRAYRIGQVRDVTIHLPMAIFAGNPEASFDRTLDALLQQKRALSREMLASPVSAHDTREIFERTIGFT